jgi:hypothetical protein
MVDNMLAIYGKKDLLEKEQYDAIFCFGAGGWSKLVGEIFAGMNVLHKINGFIDNSKEKEGTRIDVNGFKYLVYSPNILKCYCNKKIAIIITCRDVIAIMEQLKRNDNLDNAHVYYIQNFEMAEIDALAMQKEIPNIIQIEKKQIIPKVIHYCWFGGNPIPDNCKAWVESWHKFCPDYEIVEWNESNYDVSKNKFMLQAYEQKKWGFVSDYARLDIIYNHGGIYFDTDVELISGFDELLYQKGFAGFERDEYVNFGVGFGAVAGLPIIKEISDIYESLQFVNDDGSLNMVRCPEIQTNVLLRHGLKRNGEYQVVDGMAVFPEKMFCGKNQITRKLMLKPYSKSIHHFDASWMDTEYRQRMKEKEKLVELFTEYDIRTERVHNDNGIYSDI